MKGGRHHELWYVIRRCQRSVQRQIEEVSFRVDEEFIQYVKELNIDDDIKKDLIKKSKDRAFFDMLLINALKD